MRKNSRVRSSGYCSHGCVTRSVLLFAARRLGGGGGGPTVTSSAERFLFNRRTLLLNKNRADHISRSAQAGISRGFYIFGATRYKT